MSEEQVCLTLILSRQLREELFDFLGEQSDLVQGWTAADAAGHGAGLRLPTAAERVKGHADRVIAWSILPAGEAKELVGRLRKSFAGANLVYWIAPVTEFGVID
jgi:hypothetical protein